MNLLCNASAAGKEVQVVDTNKKVVGKLDCGHGVPVRIPYYVLGLLMVGTMYYQQRQMQRAAPPGASQQQQMLTKIMPLISIFWGFIVPSGVILYWTTSNLVQIGQQHFLLRAGGIREPIGGDGKRADGTTDGVSKGRPAGQAPARASRGFFASMLERAEAERTRRQGQGQSSSAKPEPGSAAGSPAPRAQAPPARKPSSGGGSARSRKKRRKR
jgi:hypothetical protein